MSWNTWRSGGEGRGLLAVGLLSVALACASAVSTEREVALGQREAERVARVMGLAPHADAAAYVSAIGQRLAPYAARQDVTYSFQVVDTPEPNAFALPGGPVYVSRGLLALANAEDEVALALAHEIGHVVARHSIKRISLATPFSLLAGLPAAVVGSVNRTLGQVVALPGALAGSMVLAPFSREQEREADRIGIGIGAAAGYDPRALSRLLVALEREDRLLRGTARKADFFATHPSSPDRIRGVERYAAGLAVAPRAAIEPTRMGFLRRIEGLRLGRNPSRGVFVGASYLHPDLGLRLRFPKGWQTEDQPTLVIAVEPDSAQRVFVFAAIATEGDDPTAGIEADEVPEELRGAVVRGRVNGLPSARLFALRAGNALDVHWIAHGGFVYRIAGVCPLGAYDRLRPEFEAVAESFRALTPSDLAGIRERRLRIAEARAGESLRALLARTDTSWKPELAALANGLPWPAPPLAVGFPTKISREEPFAPDPGR